MGVAATTAGKRVRQTFQRFNYQPGKSQLFLMTGVPFVSGGGTGITVAAGAFDDDNGIFMSIDDGTPKFTIRSNATGTPVDTEVAQSSWNGDKLDGTGESGVTLDPTMTQIFWFDMEWLGVGTVRCGIVHNGAFILCHSFHHANNETAVYMSTPNLPLRYSIENDGTGAASVVEHICTTVVSEGGLSKLGRLDYKSTAGTHVDANAANTIYAIIGLRLKSAYIGQSIGFVKMSMINTVNDDFEWMLLFNPTVAGTFTYASHASYCALEVAAGVTANTVTGGTPMSGGFVTASNSGGGTATDLDNALRLGAAIDGTVDEVVLCCRPLTANADIEASITWRELA